MIQKGSLTSKKNPMISQLKVGEVFTLPEPKNEREKGVFMVTTQATKDHFQRAVCLYSGIFLSLDDPTEVIHHPKAYFNLGEDE